MFLVYVIDYDSNAMIHWAKRETYQLAADLFAQWIKHFESDVAYEDLDLQRIVEDGYFNAWTTVNGNRKLVTIYFTDLINDNKVELETTSRKEK